MLYLTPIYMWDKDLGYMLVKPKSPLPPNSAIRDGAFDVTTPQRCKNDLAEERLIKTMQELSAQRALSNKQLQSVLCGEDCPPSKKINVIITSMATTRQQIVSHDTKLASLTVRLRATKEGPEHSNDQGKWVKAVKEQMKAPREMVLTLRNALKLQRKDLEKLTNKQNADDAVKSDVSSSGYRSSWVEMM